jgi:protein phosphatase
VRTGRSGTTPADRDNGDVSASSISSARPPARPATATAPASTASPAAAAVAVESAESAESAAATSRASGAAEAREAKEATVPPVAVASPELADQRVLEVPALSLVVLVGAAGAGKSTFASRRFGATQVISSDDCRAMVIDDPREQTASRAAFEVLHLIVRRRLEFGRLTVVDATNVEPRSRAELLDIARAHDVPAVAIVLDLPEELCAERAASRDRVVSRAVVHRQYTDLRAAAHLLDTEGFAAVHVLRTPAEVDAARVVPVRSRLDRRAETGPFDVIGDVHGCRVELERLLGLLGYVLERDGLGGPVGASHPEGRRAVFVGDLIDRGPDIPGVLRLVMGMTAAGTALAVAGNHEFKLVRALRGRVGVAGGAVAGGGGAGVGRAGGVGRSLARTIEQIGAEPAGFAAEVQAFCAQLAPHLVLDGGALVVAHAGLKEAYHGRDSGRVRAFALFGDTTGERDEYGFPVRLPWADDYHGRAMVLYGHTPVAEPRWVNNTLCLDTGCCFGGALTALRYPERELVSVPAEREYFAPKKPLRPVAPVAPAAG